MFVERGCSSVHVEEGRPIRCSMKLKICRLGTGNRWPGAMDRLSLFHSGSVRKNSEVKLSDNGALYSPPLLEAILFGVRLRRGSRLGDSLAAHAAHRLLDLALEV